MINSDLEMLLHNARKNFLELCFSKPSQNLSWPYP